MKILKNTTLNKISIGDIGISILAGDSLPIQPQDYLLLAGSSEITSFIQSGDIVVNDGTYDLSPDDGENFIKYPDFAKNIQLQTEATRNSAVGNTLQEFFDRWAGPDTSSKPQYDSNLNLTQVELFSGPVQTTQYRVAKAVLSYNVSMEPTSETWEFYKSDGTTVEKTVVLSYTFTNTELTKTEMVTT